MALQDIPFVVLLGPTAVGKSEVAVELALETGGEIVSADSMQIYRGMDIGTAKPSAEERRGVPHHLFDALEISELCDAARFRAMAMAAIDGIRKRGALPIVTGGSGLYIRALTQGVFDGPGRDEALRARLEEEETPVLREQLVRVDPKAAAKIGVGDRRRMIRALEIFEMTGTPISSRQTQWGGHVAGRDVMPRLVGLSRSRAELYRRCDARVDRMFGGGFLDEVRRLMREGLARSPTAVKAIGYSDAMRHLSGEMTLVEAVKQVKQKTRNYVKRQTAWFRREPGIVWLEVADGEDAATTAERALGAFL